MFRSSRWLILVTLIMVVLFGSISPVSASEPVNLEEFQCHWQFDEGSGNMVYDSCGEYNGTIYGATWTTGVSREGLSFDGINDYIDINDATLGNNYEALTVEAWINPENLPASPGRRYIVNACDEDSFSNNSLFSLHLATVASDSRYLPASFRGTNIIFGVRAKDQPDINAAIALSDASYWAVYNRGMAIRNNYPELANGEWLHVVGVYDGSSTKLYLNGQLEATSTNQPDGVDRSVSGPLTNTSLPRRIGISSYKNPGGPWAGKIDEVKIYSRALTPAEILTSYSSGLEPEDTTPPVITPEVTGTLGNNNWYTSDVTVSWDIVDDESTIINSTGDESVTLSEDTSGTIFTCEAASEGGTTSESITIKRDATAPVIEYTGNAGVYLVSDTINISYTAIDNLSGIASNTGEVICGLACSFPVGLNTFSATVIDAAGNVATSSTSFTVVVSYKGMRNLIKQFVTAPGIMKSLQAKLDAAEAAENRGNKKAMLNILNAFINEVNAQTGKALSNEQAEILITLAQLL